jgi:diguanylate cyclase (GGDEF)-like protein
MSASILVVDDDPLLVQMIGAMLGDLGRVRFATSGEAALRMLAQEPPDVVLLDSEMPGMNGFEVCRTIRAGGDHDDIPVIFVTAHRDEEFELRCFEAGAVDFIHKPVNAPILRARVRTQVRLKQALDTIRRMALTDPLTGLTNRRAFDGLLAREWKQALRSKLPIAMLMVDVDHFKQYNDTYGHPAGDACLASVAHALQEALLRPHDIVARYGGEEFAVLLPDAGAEGVRVVAQRLLEAVVSLRIPHRHGVGGVVSISLGGAVLAPCTTETDAIHDALAPSGALSALVRRADQALYQAKLQGRARACIDDTPAEGPAQRPADVAGRAERDARP